MTMIFSKHTQFVSAFGNYETDRCCAAAACVSQYRTVFHSFFFTFLLFFFFHLKLPIQKIQRHQEPMKNKIRRAK